MLSGYYGFDNAGDEAILHSIITGLKQTIPNVEITVLSANPKQTVENFNVKAINRKYFFSIFKKMIKTDLFISGGGSLLQDATGKMSIPYYLGLIKLAQIAKAKTAFFAQGVGPIKSRFYLKCISNVLRKMDLVTVRDNQSKQLLNEIGVNDIIVCADPVFFLQPAKKEIIRNILIDEEIPFNEKGPWVGVGIRDWSNNEKMINEMAIGLDKLIATHDAQIILMPFHKSVDYSIQAEIMNKMEANKQTYILKEQYQANELMGICSHLDLMIGMRLHSLIFAARQRVPLIGISYDIKIDSFLEELQMKPCCHSDNISNNKIVEEADKIFKQKEEAKDMIAKKAVLLEQNAWQAIILVADLMAGRI